MHILNAYLPAADAETFTQMVEHQADLHTIVQKVRLCRLKLGAVLNRLENHEFNPDALKSIDDRTDDVSNEIRVLVELIQRLTDVA